MDLGNHVRAESLVYSVVVRKAEVLLRSEMGESE